MIGFHDYVINPRSGRPEPHQSWVLERFTTRVMWAFAITSCAGSAVYYLRWQEGSGALHLLLGGLLAGAVAYVRSMMLQGKEAALRQASERYESMFRKPTLSGS